ncbi:MAG TPA: hypothetical protein VEC16_03255 [Alphaproteobacteria bacterium]|nr:hypothetical protein [Alphaproteobacteria bacterium]
MEIAEQTKEKTLEEMSLWYKYKSAAWPKDGPVDQEVTETGKTIHNIERTVRIFNNPQGFSYLSSPVTTGKIMYGLQREHGISEKTHPDFREKILMPAMNQNYQSALRFLDAVQKYNLTDKCTILPADLEPSRQRWSQPEFQALWLTMISEKASEMFMHDDWEYSDGASEEFTHVMQLKLGVPKNSYLAFYNTKEGYEKGLDRMKNIEVYGLGGDQFGYSKKSISLEDGIEKIEKSVKQINNWGFQAPKLENCLNLLYWTKEKLSEGFYQK